MVGILIERNVASLWPDDRGKTAIKMETTQHTHCQRAEAGARLLLPHCRTTGRNRDR
jgi:hypothetical protein